jgi:hypothetical protein
MKRRGETKNKNSDIGYSSTQPMTEPLFSNIMIPVSSEFFSRAALQRGAELATLFGSAVTVIYIIEERAYQQVDKLSDAFRTTYERAKTRSDLTREQVSTADAVIFDEAERIFSPRNLDIMERILQGEFSTVVQRELQRGRFDLVVMGFEKGCLVDYRILDEATVPVWVESREAGSNIMLAVCSNIAPNQRVPDISVRLASAMNWDLHVLYVVDTQDAVEVDATGKRSQKKSVRELLSAGESFLKGLASDCISTELVQGSLERETVKATRRHHAGLVVLGREQKERKILGIPTHYTKRKLAEKCGPSLLFIH